MTETPEQDRPVAPVPDDPTLPGTEAPPAEPAPEKRVERPDDDGDGEQ